MAAAGMAAVSEVLEEMGGRAMEEARVAAAERVREEEEATEPRLRQSETTVEEAAEVREEV